MTKSKWSEIIVRLTPVMTAHLHQLRDSRSTDSINTLLIAAGQTPHNTKSTILFQSSKSPY